MDAYLAIPIIEFFFVTFLLVLIKLRGRNHLARKPFVVFLVSMALWGFCIFQMRLTPDLSQAFLWEKLVFISIISAALFFFEFTLVFTDTNRQNWIMLPLYILYIAFIALIPTGLVVSGMQMMWYGKAPIIGPLFFPYTVLAYAPIGLGLKTLITHYKRSVDSNEKIRDLSIIGGISCMIVGATTDYLPSIGFNMYPLGIIGNILYCTLATVAMLKYGLLEMRTVLRKGTAYSMTSAFIIAFFAIVSFLIGSTFSDIINPLSLTIIILCIVLSMVLFRPILTRVQASVDRWFLGGQYNSLQALQQFAPEGEEIKELTQLASKLVTLIANSMQSSNVYLLMQNFTDETFEPYSYFGVQPIQKLSLVESKLLSAALSYNDSPIYSDDLKSFPSFDSLNSGFRDSLFNNNIEIIIPLKNKNRIIGILLLGNKVTDTSYTKDDIGLLAKVFKKLEVTIASAYENEKNQKKQADLIDRILATMRNSVLVLNNNFEIVLANKEFNETFHVTENDVHHKKLDEVISEVKLIAAISDSLNTRQPLVDIEFRCEIDGEPKILVASTMFLGDDETLLIFQDVTTEREKQERMFVTERLASIGEMAAGLAHELNNPLTGVLSLSQLVMESEVSESIRQDVKDIHGEATRAANIVKNLLMFTRPQKEPKNRTDVNRLIADVLRLREYEQRVNNIEVKTNFNAVLPPVVADSLQLQQVFLNIILNAEHAMLGSHNGGTLTITTSTADNQVVISFADDGPGIAEENLAKIFNPFFTTKDVGVGSGLGLSICYGIIKSQNGRISVESELGRGTEFIIELAGN